MAITLNKSLTSVVVGTVDVALSEAIEAIIEKEPQKENVKYVQDVVRFAEVGIGALASMYGFYPDITETMFYSATPLAIHSVRKLVKEVMVKGKGYTPSSLGFRRVKTQKRLVRTSPAVEEETVPIANEEEETIPVSD